MGDVFKPVVPNVCDGGSFMRVQVSVDISLPLCRGRLISLNNKKHVWVSFKYESLPNLCYWCGRLTHDDRDCDRWIESEGTLRNAQKEFRSELRAPPFMLSKKNVLKVPGFYAGKKTNGREGQKQGGDHPTQSQSTEKTNMSNHSKLPLESCTDPDSHFSVRYVTENNIQSELSAPMMTAQSVDGNVSKVFTQNEVTGAVQSGKAAIIGELNIGNLVVDEGINAPAVSKTQLKKFDEEFTRLNEPDLNQSRSLGSRSRAAVSEVADLEAKASSKSCDKQCSIRVFDHSTQLRVLPTWACRNRGPEKPKEAMGKQKILNQNKSDKKRTLEEFSDLPDISSKRHHALQTKEGASFILVEADHQPR